MTKKQSATLLLGAWLLLSVCLLERGCTDGRATQKDGCAD